MLLNLKKVKESGFTMVEVIVVCTIFALLISGIVLAINRTFIFMNNTRVQIRATNLTREGMEMMFNIRDTNRRKCSGQKDQFRLYLGSGAVASNEGNCNPDGNLFEEGIYTIKEGVNGEGDRFVYAEDLNVDTNKIDEFYSLEGFFKDEYEIQRNSSVVTFTGTYTYLSGSVPVTGDISDLLGNGVEFYRIARVYGIYNKTANTANEEATSFTNSSPKEMRFCVKTFYRLGAGTHSSELCSLMTNFME